MRIVIAPDTIPAPSCGEKDRRFACEYPVDNRALSPDFGDALDRWSPLQPDKPSRSEAIRRIVDRSMARKT